MNLSQQQSWKSLVFGLVLFGAILGPLFVWGSTKNIYVDRDNKGSQDGSLNHPYKSIGQALDHVHGSANVFVAKGHYSENITIPSNTKLIGAKDRGDVIIEADDRGKPTVIMHDNTEINKVTVKSGKDGIRVAGHARAKILRSIVKESRRDGIHIYGGSRDKNEQVTIDRVDVKNNRMAGIFSEKRRVIVTNVDVLWNGDGIDFLANVKGWLADSTVNENHGSGVKVVLDGSSIAGTKNSIRHNGREGVEVNAYGGDGNFFLEKSSLIGNGRYGLAKVARNSRGFHALANISLPKDRVEGNKVGGVSRLLSGF